MTLSRFGVRAYTSFSSQMSFEPGFSANSLEGSVLLLPTVSVANVPQFSVDLLIHSLDSKKIATLSDKYLYSFASPVDYTADSGPKPGVSFALECYKDEKKNITLLQQRSPILPGFASHHLTEVLLPFIKAGKFSQVILLDLIDAAFSSENFPGDIRMYTSDDGISDGLLALSLSGNRAEPLSKACAQTAYSKSLVQEILRVMPLNYIAMYVYEGDNFHDAQILSAELSTLLKLSIEKWKIPVSWAGVYGARPIPTAVEQGLYG